MRCPVAAFARTRGAGTGECGAWGPPDFRSLRRLRKSFPRHATMHGHVGNVPHGGPVRYDAPMSHRTIIDGYNLLHAAGLVRGKLIGKQLEGARLRLMKRLAYQMSKEQRAATTVVFDAKTLLVVASREELIEGIRVLFPEPGHEADELIEEMIAQDPQPRELRIVSSDRRLHRAARERMATAINSDRFLDELDERRAAPAEGSASNVSRPPVPIPKENSPSGAGTQVPTGDVDYWLKEFGEIEVPEEADLTAALEQSLSGIQSAETPPATTAKPTTPAPAPKSPSAIQNLIIPLAPRPGIATLPSRGKSPPSQATPDPEPLRNQPGPQLPDADLEFWKDALKQVLDEERGKP